MLNVVMFKIAALSQMLRARFEQEEGQGLVEYGLIIALVSVALVGALTLMAGGLGEIFTYINGQLVAPAAP